MPRSASVSAVPRRVFSASKTKRPKSGCATRDRRNSLEVLDPLKYPATPREYDSWPCDSDFLACDSFFLLPDSVLNMDAGSFRADLTSLDPALSASLPDWGRSSTYSSRSNSGHDTDHERSGVALLHSHQGLTVTTAGHGTILIGGGGGSGSSDGRVNNIVGSSGGAAVGAAAGPTTSSSITSGPDISSSTSEQQHATHNTTSKNEPANKDALLSTTGQTTAQHNLTTTTKQPQLAGPNELFFGTGERSSGASHRDREERLRQLRDKHTLERQQKLEELKEHAASAQRFREQQEVQRRQRLQELRCRDHDRRSQVEERRKYMELADQNRRDATYKKTVERDQRLETKRRNERSNIVFAFGSSTPRMLDPKELDSFWGSRRATSSSNVALADDGNSLSCSNRRSSDCVDNVAAAAAASGGGGGSITGAPELARKRATSAQGLDRNPYDLRMSSSMYEVFHWTDNTSTGHSPLTPQGGDDLMTRSMTASVARRRTDLHPITPSLREAAAAGKPRHRSPGIGSSGGVTPASRPTSAQSQASNSAAANVAMRTRPAARKPRPMSIAGTAPTAADRPRSPANRESRNSARNTSSSSISSVKSSRAKSAGGSDNSAPTTPARAAAAAAAPRTPKRTVQQVKAENAAKKADKAKATALAATKRSTPKTTPAASPSVESKSLTAAASKKTVPKKITNVKDKKTGEEISQGEKQNGSLETNISTVAETTTDDSSKSEVTRIVNNGTETMTVVTETQETVVMAADSITQSSVMEQIVTTSEIITSEKSTGQTVVTTVTESSDSGEVVQEIVSTGQLATVTQATVENGVDIPALPVENGSVVVETSTNESVTATTVKNGTDDAADSTRNIAQSGNAEEANTATPAAAEKPVTGYATEEEYKTALAEKRRLAREAKERELELERQRKEEEEEKERQEELDMLRMMEEQKKQEDERFRKAIEQADRDREEEAKRKEEEEKQRIEAERLEEERRLEAEEKKRREEEERTTRKNRVAAIMARTRNKRGNTTPSKGESKTPSDENNSMSDALQGANLTDSMIDKMSDSMIAAVASLESEGSESCQASSGIASEPVSDFSSQPGSDVSGTQQPVSDVSSHGTVENTSDCLTSGASSLEQTVRIDDHQKPQQQDAAMDLLASGLVHINIQEQTNGNSAVPMDTTPTQSMDLIGSLNGHTNGVDNSNNQHNHPSVDLLSSFDPFSSAGSPSPDPNSTVISTTTTTEFEQIIDASQTKLNNEDAINSNPPAPFIAFEQNLNKKSTQENTSVPDILL